MWHRRIHLPPPGSLANRRFFGSNAKIRARARFDAILGCSSRTATPSPSVAFSEILEGLDPYGPTVGRLKCRYPYRA